MQFPTTIQPFADDLERLYRRRTKNPGLAEEVVEFAVSTCWLRYGDQDPCTLQRLVNRTAANHFLNLLKQGKTRAHTSDELELIPARAPAGLPTEWVVALHEGLSKLPSNYRDVLNLVYFYGHTKKKTAQLLGVSLNTVKRRHTQGVAALRAKLRRTVLENL